MFDLLEFNETVVTDMQDFCVKIRNFLLPCSDYPPDGSAGQASCIREENQQDHLQKQELGAPLGP
ncbi:MAG: hypothetical protein V4634_04205 [Pseudomonadota bacterium]